MAGLAMLGCLGLASEAHGAKAKTNIELYDMSYGDDQTNYEGEVASPRRSCEQDRRVTVYRKRPGKDLKMGSDRASSESMSGGFIWFFSKPAYALPGTFYAKAKGTKKCKPGRSENYEFNDCMPAGSRDARGTCRR
jgi:hypothetical protein